MEAWNEVQPGSSACPPDGRTEEPTGRQRAVSEAWNDSQEKKVRKHDRRSSSPPIITHTHTHTHRETEKGHGGRLEHNSKDRK
mmetsp:Transcript_50497/g.99354  ORF Transcript_50497/g.99354 Transcript_50497/m.99354 type:complete len:83 (-) Transcript_50497:201-449(-)